MASYTSVIPQLTGELAMQPGAGDDGPPETALTPAGAGSPVTRSWSQFSSWRSCGKAYELARIRRVPRRPAVWLPAGTAVHAVIEQYLRETLREGRK